MNIEIKKSLSVLELGDLARIIEMREKDIKLVDLSYEKRLELLLETLIQERENRLINRLIKNAYFKYPSASLESLDYDSQQIKKSTILNLATMGFVANATNLVITGPTGAGKTYLACALGVEACRQTYRVLYIRMPDLMRNFENQSDNLRELTKYRKRMQKTSMNCLNSAAETIPPFLSGSILSMNGMAGSAGGHRRIPSWTG